MGLLENILSAFSGTAKKSETEKEFEEFSQKRKWEREVFDSAVKEWVLKSGLAPIMIEQTRGEYGTLDGIEKWPPKQHEHYLTIEFDERNPQHREILDHIESESRDD